MRRNRYLHPGDLVPVGTPKRHVRSDDGRVILYWDLPEERVFLQAFDSLGNFRVVDGVVQAPKKVYTCAVCKTIRSPEQVCSSCRSTYSVDGLLPVWIEELIKIQDRAIQNGYQVQSLDAFPAGPPLKTSHWPLNQSKAFVEATQLIEAALREPSSNSSSGMKLSECKTMVRSVPPSKPRWNGYRYI